MMKYICALLLSFHLLVMWCGGVEAHAWWYAQLGLSLDGLREGKVWQVFSYAMLHGSLWHLSINVALLYVLGGLLEKRVGWLRALILLVLGVLGGGVLQSVFYVCAGVEPQSLLVGISGGWMAVLLALTTLDPYRVLRPLRLRARHLGLGFLLSEGVFVLMDPGLGLPVLAQWGEAASGVFGDSFWLVAHACHFGGGLVGWLLARWWRRDTY